MKKTILSIFIVLLGTTSIIGQNTPGFNYQAVIRNAAGEIVSEKDVSIQISILKDNINGDVVYRERFNSETNEFGLVNLIIGKGNVQRGNFNEIEWPDHDFFIEVGVDISGGVSFTSMGTSQLLSVPYAQYAFSAGGWSDKEGGIYTDNKVGIGTDSPTGMLEVVSDGKNTSETPIFEVKNAKGETVFAVYENGVEIYIDEDNSDSKARGGFAVSGRTSTKKEGNEIFKVTPGLTEVFVNESTDDKARGGFAVSGRTSTKKEGNEIFKVTPGLTEVFVNESTDDKARGGFAVSGRTSTKNTQDIMHITPGFTRFYVDESSDDKARGGFAVSGRTSTKDQDNEILKVTPGLTEVFVDESAGDKARGGFAVSGRTSTKDIQDIMHITPVYTRFFVDESGNKARGGFAVSGRTSTKEEGDEIFKVTPGLTEVFVDESTVDKARGGFAVSGRTSTKDIQDIMHITPGYTRFFVDESASKARGGFAVSGRTSTKQEGDEIFRITPGLTEIFVDGDPGSKARGGFAVSGRTSTKDNGLYDILTVIPERTDIFIKPNPDEAKSFPDGFSVSMLDPSFQPTELFSVSEAGAIVNTGLAIAPRLSTADVTEITQTTATTGGATLPYAGTDIHYRGVVYSTSPQPTVSHEYPNPSLTGIVWDDEVPENGYGEFTVNIEHLLAGTTYHVRAFAINEDELVGYGPVKTFTTNTPDELTFTILEIETNTSIDNAVITLSYMDNPYALPITNQPGDFVFNVASGRYNFSVQADKYIETEPEFITVDGTTQKTAYLEPAPSTVSFSVIDQHGTPVNNANVYITKDDDTYDTYHIYTDENGKAVFYPSPGTWQYQVSLKGYEDAQGSFTINQEEMIEIDVTINKEPKYTVTLQVENQQGDPSVNASVFLFEGGLMKSKDDDKVSFYYEEQLTDDNGVAVFHDVPPGESYMYEVNHETDGDYLSDMFAVKNDMNITVVLGETTGGTVQDLEGNMYQTIIISEREWMAENLRATKYNDGTPIKTGLNDTEWQNSNEGAYTIYPHSDIDEINTDDQMLSAYGALYNWNAVIDEKNICPAGWYVPSDIEWENMISEIGGNTVGGGKLKSQRTSPGESHPRWDDPNTGATNETGLSSLPAGYRDSNGNFQGIGGHGFWWSSTQSASDQDKAWVRYLFFDGNNVTKADHDKSLGLSVRCIKEEYI